MGQYDRQINIPVTFDETGATHPGIACVWARKKIEQLASRATYDRAGDLAGKIRLIALEYSLMSAYTAFVAVDTSRQTAGNHGVTVAVPVPIPEGVRYDTTVQD